MTLHLLHLNSCIKDTFSCNACNIDSLMQRQGAYICHYTIVGLVIADLFFLTLRLCVIEIWYPQTLKIAVHVSLRWSQIHTTKSRYALCICSARCGASLQPHQIWLHSYLSPRSRMQTEKWTRIMPVAYVWNWFRSRHFCGFWGPTRTLNCGLQLMQSIKYGPGNQRVTSALGE